MFSWLRKPQSEPPGEAEIARRYVVEDPVAAGVPVLERKWYYRIEVEPGVFTDAVAPDSVHLTRSMLRNVELKGRSLLDIGTMEALIPILASRREASNVTAYDRLDFGERVAWLKDRLGVEFDYLGGFPLRDLADRLGGEAHPLFDVVVFSGVLYHMFDPLGGILAARRFVRNGGLLVLETAAILSKENAAYFNATGRYYAGDNFWFCSVENLDYLLRLCRLRPVDCCFMRQRPQEAPPPGTESHNLCRVAVTCEAVDQPPAEPGDDWMPLAQQKDFAEHVRWEAFTAPVSDPVAYSAPAARQLEWRPSGSLALYESLRRQPENRPTDLEREVALRLDAVY